MRARTPLAFVGTFVLFVGGITAGNQLTLRAYAAGGDPYQGLDTLSRAMTQIQRSHVEALSTQELVWAAVDGMADALDRHSMFFDPEAYARILEESEGQYYGVGVESLPHEAGGIRVVDVLPDSPAERAGVRVEDRIVEVDGQDITAMTFDEATGLIEGPRGEVVRFGIERGGERLELELVRDTIVTPAATGDQLAPGIGYARISGFRAGVSDQLAAVLGDLDVSEGLVLDLRGNPGGLLSEAAAVVDLFVAEDAVVVSTRGRAAEELEQLRSSAGDGDYDMALAVLVDGNSASGSEIVAGALQDLGRATIVGQPTWGKGSVQRIYEYEDGSALKLTVARYYLPSGRGIEEQEGIVPDVIADLVPPEAAASSLLRARIERDIDDEAERRELLALLDRLHDPPPHELAPSFRGSAAERLERDGQLRAALGVLTGP